MRTEVTPVVQISARPARQRSIDPLDGLFFVKSRDDDRQLRPACTHLSHLRSHVPSISAGRLLKRAT